jgi:hypothetical protein
MEDKRPVPWVIGIFLFDLRVWILMAQEDLKILVLDSDSACGMLLTHIIDLFIDP